MIRRTLMTVGSVLLLTLLLLGTRAKADSFYFEYNGGSWSHSRHRGWHRYWGGPRIGYYYAARPVYIVPGYTSARYYYSPDYWYSDPGYRVSVTYGGGGHHRGRGHDYYVSHRRHGTFRYPQHRHRW